MPSSSSTRILNQFSTTFFILIIIALSTTSTVSASSGEEQSGSSSSLDGFYQNNNNVGASPSPFSSGSGSGSNSSQGGLVPFCDISPSTVTAFAVTGVSTFFLGFSIAYCWLNNRVKQAEEKAEAAVNRLVAAGAGARGDSNIMLVNDLWTEENARFVAEFQRRREEEIRERERRRNGYSPLLDEVNSLAAAASFSRGSTPRTTSLTPETSATTSFANRSPHAAGRNISGSYRRSPRSPGVRFYPAPGATPPTGLTPSASAIQAAETTSLGDDVQSHLSLEGSLNNNNNRGNSSSSAAANRTNASSSSNVTADPLSSTTTNNNHAGGPSYLRQGNSARRFQPMRRQPIPRNFVRPGPVAAAIGLTRDGSSSVSPTTTPGQQQQQRSGGVSATFSFASSTASHGNSNNNSHNNSNNNNLQPPTANSSYGTIP